MSIEKLLNGQTVDPDLDVLMARVREAAGIVDIAAPVAPAPGEPAVAADEELAQVLAAQAAWNERITKSLALVVECLRTLQDGWQELDARVRGERDGLSTRAKNPRHRRARVRRANPAAGGGRRP